MRTLTSVLCASALLLGAAACGDDEPTSADDSGEESPDQAVPSSTEVTGATTTTTSDEPVWPGPVRDPSDVVHPEWTGPDAVQFGWADALDASERWADVKGLEFTYGNHGSWHFDLAASPPPLEYLEPGVVIAYGLVLDTNADGAADYVVGIDNDAPRQGDFRAWLTDLASGETDEQVGPPYGSPIDFAYPSVEHTAGDELPEGRPAGDETTDVFLTFLPGGGPADMDLNTVRFYAWTSAARDGQVFAHDYAPDTGWFSSE